MHSTWTTPKKRCYHTNSMSFAVNSSHSTYKQTLEASDNAINDTQKEAENRVVGTTSCDLNKVAQQIDKGNQQTAKADRSKAGRQSTFGTAPNRESYSIVQKVNCGKQACQDDMCCVRNYLRRPIEWKDEEDHGEVEARVVTCCSKPCLISANDRKRKPDTESSLDNERNNADYNSARILARDRAYCLQHDWIFHNIRLAGFFLSFQIKPKFTCRKWNSASPPPER